MSKLLNTIQLIKQSDNLLVKNSREDFFYFKKLTISQDKNIQLSLKDIKSAIPTKLRIYKKKMFLKGLGYKVLIENGVLSFKLNFSHELKMVIPSYIKRIVVNKTNIVFESHDLILLGNFIEKIYNLRPKDNYKGKGFSLKSKLVPIKEVKKK